MSSTSAPFPSQALGQLPQIPGKTGVTPVCPLSNPGLGAQVVSNLQRFRVSIRPRRNPGKSRRSSRGGKRLAIYPGSVRTLAAMKSGYFQGATGPNSLKVETRLIRHAKKRVEFALWRVTLVGATAGEENDGLKVKVFPTTMNRPQARDEPFVRLGMETKKIR
ncbi:hypothetical protein FVF58_06125 [Paraburkholderia panacisoli]|uniref:Uncharacterized protein n=1 Tax=Paraburkholderia panacisoli TaxID=2603818 RepID=A0A5B0HH39_9BURK|nr:hypothetical protein [Paraburkholderia panacisoli]KAA1014427.1 hypothetical protein FVF58_06125 [Paraburkholderia panacisoli]